MAQLTPQDINKYITTIRLNFENAYKTQTEDERLILIKSWFAILKDYPKEVCDNAVMQAIKYAKFAPRIGDIVEQIEKMKSVFERDECELWAELSGCLREVESNVYAFRFNAIDRNGLTQGENARIRVREIFNGLSPELKEYCRNTNGLIEIAEYTDEQLSYERGRFMRVMPQIRERAKMRQQMPESVTGLLQRLSDNWVAIGCAAAKQIEGE